MIEGLTDGVSGGTLLTIGGSVGAAIGGGLASVINAVANFRKQPFEQAMLMVTKLEVRVEALAKANERCQEEHAKQQLEIGSLRQEVSYLRSELQTHERTGEQA